MNLGRLSIRPILFTPGYLFPVRVHARFFSISSSESFCSASKDSEIQIDFLTNEDLPKARVAVWKLNRPPSNAVGRHMLEELQNATHQLEGSISDISQETPRCLVLASALAPKVFSAGADLKERKNMSEQQAAMFVHHLRTGMDRLSRLPIPVIAAIDGVAVGGGLEIALAADIRISSRQAKFGLPETSLAIVPGAGGTQRLPRLIGVAKAKELIFTADRFDGSAAFDYGLVQKLAEDGEDAFTMALDMAWKIARNGPLAIQAAKWAIDKGMKTPSMEEALRIERQAYDERVLPSSDRLEGLAAFQEKRPPDYKGE